MPRPHPLQQGAPLKSPSPAKAFFKNLMGGSPSKVERDFVPPVHRKRSPRREVLPAPAVLPASPPTTNLKLKEDTVMEVKIMVDTTWPAVDTSRLARALAQVPGVRGGRLLAAAQRDAALADNLTTLAEEVAGLGREAEATYGHRQNVATLEACFTEVLVMMDLNGERCTAHRNLRSLPSSAHAAPPHTRSYPCFLPLPPSPRMQAPAWTTPPSARCAGWRRWCARRASWWACAGSPGGWPAWRGWRACTTSLRACTTPRCR
jgi:hypothetical protein